MSVTDNQITQHTKSLLHNIALIFCDLIDERGIVVKFLFLISYCNPGHFGKNTKWLKLFTINNIQPDKNFLSLLLKTKEKSKNIPSFLSLLD